jgi:quinol monooxygenase YgiN
MSREEVLEVSARMTVREGKLEGFTQQVDEIIRQTKERDTKTLRYEWYLSDDGTECEVREAYRNADGLIEHRMHIGEALYRLFEEFADDHAVTIYGRPTPPLVALAKAEKGVIVTSFSFLRGLDS